MIKKDRMMLMCLSVFALSGCGTTRRFVDDPKLTIDGSDQTVGHAAAELFGRVTPYTLNLCEADAVSKECKKGSDSIKANGVGGLLLPLSLHVSAMTINKQSQSQTGWAMETSVQSRVDAIPPMCQMAHGQILLKDNGTISVRLRNFYCNWVVVGNVLVNADFSIDNINPQDKAFNGYYKITFHGTGNAAGSGYYRAVIVPVESKDSTRQARN